MMIKLGQSIKFKNDRKVKVANGGIVTVKAGDIARVVKKIDDETAEVVYLTGEAKGLSQNLPIKVDDKIDTEGIAKKIMNEINDN